MDRRKFGKYLSFTTLPLLINPGFSIDKIGAKQESSILTNVPDVLAGRELTSDEKIWIENFFKNYNKMMENIREASLPIELLPAFIPEYPLKKSKKIFIREEE